MTKQVLTLTEAIRLIQTPDHAEGSDAKQSKGLRAYADLNKFDIASQFQQIIAHLRQVYGVEPGKQNLKGRAFVNTKKQPIQRGILLVNRRGQILYGGRWWDEIGLIQFGIRESVTHVQPLGQQQSPSFAPGVEAASKFQATFRARRPRRNNKK